MIATRYQFGKRMMDETLNLSMHSNSNRRKHRLKPPDNLIQSLQIEKYRLDFLHKCKFRKRSPQSLRLRGGFGLPSQQKITMISKMESEVLLEAIKNKEKDINNLEEKVKRNTTNMVPLARGQYKNWIQHFKKKLHFFKNQDKSKWKDWPSKSKKKNTNTKGGKMYS